MQINNFVAFSTTVVGPTMANNGQQGLKNELARSATSAFNGFVIGTHCKPVLLPFCCYWGILGGWNIFGLEQDAVQERKEWCK